MTEADDALAEANAVSESDLDALDADRRERPADAEAETMTLETANLGNLTDGLALLETVGAVIVEALSVGLLMSGEGLDTLATNDTVDGEACESAGREASESSGLHFKN